MQRLDWLEEAQKIAYQSGAWQKQSYKTLSDRYYAYAGFFYLKDE